jgi:YHS domain-containing protein
MTEYKCPVCGMEMEPDQVASETNYEGRSYYFCSDECRTKWDADPERYARETASSGMRGSSR